jgi:hypothetical protein
MENHQAYGPVTPPANLTFDFILTTETRRGMAATKDRVIFLFLIHNS